MPRGAINNEENEVENLECLPNEVNFEFIGVGHNDEKFECIVKLNSVGCCSAYTKTGDPCFFKLKGWLPIRAEAAPRYQLEPWMH